MLAKVCHNSSTATGPDKNDRDKMTKLEIGIAQEIAAICPNEDCAKTATDIAIAMPTNHTIEFWVNKILKMAENGIIARTEWDTYFSLGRV